MKHLLLCCLLACAAPLVCAADDLPAGLDLLGTGILQVSPLSGDTALVFADTGELALIDLNTDHTEPWSPDWDCRDAGWSSDGPYVDAMVSPDGQWVCIQRFVVAGDPAELAGLQYAALGCVAVVLCRPDGSQARCVALSQSVGSGPHFDFTTDSPAGRPSLALLRA